MFKFNDIKKFKRTLIIAEVSANHCGSKKNFLNHILKAKEFGADLVKIQTYEPKDMIVNKNFEIKSGLWKGKNLWKLYKQACTPFTWHKDAFRLAKKKNITLFSTPFSIRSLIFLKKFKPPLYKVASFELTDHKLINEIAKLKKPVILSTGLSTLKEINSSVKIIKKYHNKIILLYCVSGYPTPLKEINLKEIEKIRNGTGIKQIGFSDHTDGLEASLEAINNEVFMIERHFTLKKNSKSPDVKFSINPEELKILKNYSLSKKVFNISKRTKVSENSSKIFRRSIYAIKDIKKNERFSDKNIGCFRPCLGLGSENYFKILNRKSKKNIRKNEVLKREHINIL